MDADDLPSRVERQRQTFDGEEEAMRHVVDLPERSAPTPPTVHYCVRCDNALQDTCCVCGLILDSPEWDVEREKRNARVLSWYAAWAEL